VNALPALAVAAAALVALERAGAASAVAMDGHGHLITSRGQRSKVVATQHALTTAHQPYGVDVRLLAASEGYDYCSIAVAAHRGGGVVIGVALGKRSGTEADALAIERCLKAGGTNPKVRSGWYG